MSASSLLVVCIDIFTRRIPRTYVSVTGGLSFKWNCFILVYVGSHNGGGLGGHTSGGGTAHSVTCVVTGLVTQWLCGELMYSNGFVWGLSWGRGG
jgi:hypothetical protein